jgi:hypothetical protein
MHIRAVLVSLVLCVAVAVHASAQWLNFKTAGLPRTADGKVDLNAPPPKTADGKPDLSGIWEPDGTKFIRNLAADLKPEDVAMTPSAQSLFDRRKTGSLSKEEPDANCLPQGVPKIAAAPAPWRIVQTPGVTFIVYEAFTQWRQIFTDGRPLPVNPNPTWFGYSVGKWDGDTFVVETTGFNGKTTLDGMGHPSSDRLHVIERYRRRDFGHLDIETTFDDPEMYTKPFTIKVPHDLLPDTDIFESFCENEKDSTHLGQR